MRSVILLHNAIKIDRTRTHAFPDDVLAYFTILHFRHEHNPYARIHLPQFMLPWKRKRENQSLQIKQSGESDVIILTQKHKRRATLLLSHLSITKHQKATHSIGNITLAKLTAWENIHYIDISYQRTCGVVFWELHFDVFALLSIDFTIVCFTRCDLVRCWLFRSYVIFDSAKRYQHGSTIGLENRYSILDPQHA